MRWLVMAACGVLAGCGLAAPSSGAVVEDGVGRAVFETRATGTDLVKVTVLYPATEQGGLRGAAHPGVVFIQGGFVAASRYEWQARALARAGYVVAVPENEGQLAFFSIDYGKAARALLVSPPRGSLLDGATDPERIAVAGHSLGSVVAVKLALMGGFSAVVLEAGFPDSADVPALAGFTRPSLSLAGELDCSAKSSAVRDGWAALAAPSALVTLAGVTHYQFTDSQAEDEQKKCLPEVSLEDAHARIGGALLAFLDAAMTQGSVGEPALRQLDGATVEVK